MKANIFEIKRFAVHDGDGIRTTLFIKGCPLKCAWCHNPEGLSVKSELAFLSHKCINCGECVNVCKFNAHSILDGKHVYSRKTCMTCGDCVDVCPEDALKLYGITYSADELLPLLLKDKDFYKNSNGGVTISGGECLTQPDFCEKLLKRLKENDIHTAVDTCGFVNKNALDKVIPYTDVFLYDVKAIDNDVHIKCTGQSNKIILENLLYLDSKNCKIEIRYPYVPNYNDTEVDKIGEFLSKLKNVTKVKVLPYHNLAGSKYTSLDLKNTLPFVLPNDEQILHAKKVLSSYGLNVVD